MVRVIVCPACQSVAYLSECAGSVLEVDDVAGVDEVVHDAADVLRGHLAVDAQSVEVLEVDQRLRAVLLERLQLALHRDVVARDLLHVPRLLAGQRHERVLQLLHTVALE